MRFLGALLVSLLGCGAAHAGELEVERARAALLAGDLYGARRMAAEEVREGGGVEAWKIYVESASEAGLWPLVRAELEAHTRDLPVLTLIEREQDVRLGLADLDALVQVATEHPEPGRAVVAQLRWEEDRTVAPWLVTALPEAARSEEEARLRLQVYAAAGQAELVALVAHSWLKEHPDRPDVLAAAFGGSDAKAMHRVEQRWLSKVGRRARRSWDDPVYLFRAWRLLAAAGAPEAEELAARVEELGFMVPGTGDQAAEHRLATARREVDRLRSLEMYDEAVATWEAFRAVRDEYAAALDHARLLQVLEREGEAWEVALEARLLAAGPVPMDRACLDTAAHAARLADAHGLLAELALALGHTRAGREAAGIARALDPHPRWVALQAQSEVIPQLPGDEPLRADAKVQAVVDTLVDPTSGDSWERRAMAHEQAGELEAAFVAWVVGRANGADAAQGIERTWVGVSDPADVMDAALEAFHGSRRSHRERLVQIRDDDLGAAPILARAVSPGPGLLLPRWEAVDVAGEPLTSEDFAGRPYVLAVWASWCLPCLEELPVLNREVRLLGKEGTKVATVAVSVDDRQIVFERRARTDAWDDLGLAWSPDLADQLGVDGLPTSFAVGADGRILHVERGYSEPGVKRLLQHAIDADR